MKESVGITVENKVENLDPELKKIWKEVLAVYPNLSRVEIIVPDADTSLAYTGGEFLHPDNDNPDPAIVILPADGSLYERLKETRPLAIKIQADLLGRKVEELTGEDIKKFIFLHEVGHAYDFITNFESDPQIGKEDAVHTWNMLRTDQMDSLPVSGLDPNDLKMAIGEIKELVDFINMRPEVEFRLKELGIESINDLLVAQELGYRNLPKESFADQFAARFLKSISSDTI